MATLLQSRHLSVSISRSSSVVYDFVSVPENFRLWASGLGKALHKVDDEWVAEAQEGPVRIRFSERNEFGVLDHWVIPMHGLEIYIPMRVIPNGSGCELGFTLFRLPGMSDEKFAADAEWVMRDLTALKSLLESQ